MGSRKETPIQYSAIMANYSFEESYDYNDPLLPPDLFSMYEKRKGAWILYAVGFYVVTSAATFITHNFMVKGVLVGMELISNKKIKSIVEPVLVSTVKCWPKFLIALYGHFILFSDIGSFAIIGSVGFNLHIGVALSLLVMTGSQTRYSWLSIFKSLIILLTSVGFVSRICNIYNLNIELIALFILFCVFVMILPCIKAKCEQKSEENYEEYDLEENDESRKSEEMNNCCLPKAPLSILTNGTGFQLFIDWLIYINSMTVSFIPFLTMFWCNPANKRYACLWPAALLLGGVWVAGLMYLSGWWATVLGDAIGMPPELTGILFMGPLLSATNLFHGITDRKKPYMWQGITEDILADSFLGMALPYFIFQCVSGGPGGYIVEHGLLPGLLITINIVFGHLVTLMIKHKAVRISYAVILFVAYPLLFLAGSVASIYQFISL